MKLYDNDAYREEFMALVYELLASDGTNDRANQIIDAFDSAPEVETEPVQPNAPLTLDELREMEGEPVYDWMGYEWFVVSEVADDGVIMTDGTVFDIDEDSVNSAVGRFYRCKPEEGTK